MVVHRKLLLANFVGLPGLAVGATQRAGRSGARGGDPGWGGPAGGAFKQQSTVAGTRAGSVPSVLPAPVPATQDAVFLGSGCLVPPCLL